jgi:nitrite reductase/ring-hydroxylating ferredoxin subunit
MGFFKRLFGICATRPPADASCWSVQGDVVEIDLGKAKELEAKSGAVRLEGDGLPFRVLVLRGVDDSLYAFKNKCTHAGRRIDPLPGTNSVMCCSVSKSTFSYTGEKLSGPAKGALTSLEVEQGPDKLVVKLS